MEAVDSLSELLFQLRFRLHDEFFWRRILLPPSFLSDVAKLRLSEFAISQIASDTFLEAREISDAKERVKHPLKLREAHLLVSEEQLPLLVVPLLEEELLIADCLPELALCGRRTQIASL